MHLSFQIPASSLAEFIKHWSARYPDKERDGQLYDPYIGADMQTNWNALQKLFEWKNGSVIARKKLNSIRDNYFVDWVPDDDLEQRYLALQDQNGGPIWNIFYLHCRRPDVYPIYDQHTERARRYIQHGTIDRDIPSDRRSVFTIYQQEYRPLVRSLLAQDRTARQVDQALFTFGKFLKLAQPYR